MFSSLLGINARTLLHHMFSRPQRSVPCPPPPIHFFGYALYLGICCGALHVAASAEAPGLRAWSSCSSLNISAAVFVGELLLCQHFSVYTRSTLEFLKSALGERAVVYCSTHGAHRLLSLWFLQSETGGAGGANR